VHPLGASCNYHAPYAAIKDDIGGARAVHISVHLAVLFVPYGLNVLIYCGAS
jgi:hypothetical protein